MIADLKATEGNFARIANMDFFGDIAFNKDVMRIDITEFRKGRELNI